MIAVRQVHTNLPWDSNYFTNAPQNVKFLGKKKKIPKYNIWFLFSDQECTTHYFHRGRMGMHCVDKYVSGRGRSHVLIIFWKKEPFKKKKKKQSLADTLFLFNFWQL